MGKINIAELLKNCPKGMELNCTMFEDAQFIEVEEDDKPICIRTGDIYRYLTKFGTWTFDENAKCVIFPKGKTTWEGFHKPFKDGDIIYLLTEHNNEYITIFKESVSDYLETHIDIVIATSKCSLDSLFYVDNIKEQRLATEEEKKKLFKAIKDNGYKWNPENKALEKLKKPYFKIGDEIVKKNSITNSYIVSSVSCDYYGLKLPNNTGVGVLKVDEQDEWELINEPKFKVGNRIKNKLTNDYYSVIDIKCREYYIRSILTNKDYQIPFESEINYELVPNKFNINNLKPFDEVLVRDFDNETWEINFFSKLLDGRHFKCLDLSYVQCIPYKGNEHLFDTTNKCDEFYRTWES